MFGMKMEIEKEVILKFGRRKLCPSPQARTNLLTNWYQKCGKTRGEKTTKRRSSTTSWTSPKARRPIAPPNRAIGGLWRTLGGTEEGCSKASASTSCFRYARTAEDTGRRRGRRNYSNSMWAYAERGVRDQQNTTVACPERVRCGGERCPNY